MMNYEMNRTENYEAIGDALCDVFSKEPELGIKMWRCLFDSPRSQENYQVSRQVQDIMLCFMEDDNASVVLDVMERDESFVKQLFCSFKTEKLKRELMTLCRHFYRFELWEHLSDTNSAYMCCA